MLTGGYRLHLPRDAVAAGTRRLPVERELPSQAAVALTASSRFCCSPPAWWFIAAVASLATAAATALMTAVMTDGPGGSVVSLFRSRRDHQSGWSNPRHPTECRSRPGGHLVRADARNLDHGDPSASGRFGRCWPRRPRGPGVGIGNAYIAADWSQPACCSIGSAWSCCSPSGPDRRTSERNGASWRARWACLTISR